MVLSVTLISMKLPSLTYRINVLIINPDKTSDVAPLCNKKERFLIFVLNHIKSGKLTLLSWLMLVG